MTTPTQPRIAHGIARLNPEQTLRETRYQWGPTWELPVGRTGRWAMDRIYDVAIRVEFDDKVTIDRYGAPHELDVAREALTPDEQARRDEWLGWADKREAEAFVRAFNIRKRREHGDLPAFRAGAYVRGRWSSTAWHIATGRNGASWDADGTVSVGTECPQASLIVDLGSEQSSIVETGDPDRVCKRCTARVQARTDRAARESVLVPA